MTVALAILWPFLMAIWRFELGRCVLLRRSALMALLGIISLPGYHAMGWQFWLVLWAFLGLYWSLGHQWDHWHKLIYRYGPVGLVYRAAFAWWPAEWVDDYGLIDGPEAVARIAIGFLVGVPLGALWLA